MREEVNVGRMGVSVAWESVAWPPARKVTYAAPPSTRRRAQLCPGGESVPAVMTALRAVLQRYGLPMALYTDGAHWAVHTPGAGGSRSCRDGSGDRGEVHLPMSRRRHRPLVSSSERGAIPMIVTGTHDPYLVALSILVASFASYTALDLAGRVWSTRGLARRVWLVAAAITMGGGIWSMHFIAMLAFKMPIPMSYDIGMTTLSLVVAIFVTSGGFYVISRQRASPLRLVLSGIFIGLGIIAMHYTGMAAMRGPAELSYDRLFVALSLVIAIGASTAALWLAFQTTGPGQQLVAAVVMGLAISGMHYTAMRAAIFTTHGPFHEAQGRSGLDQTNLALVVAGITFVVLAFALIASLSEQKRAEEALRQARADLAHVNRVTTMGALTASLAHEVNQPIAAAVINAHACLNWLAGDTPNLDEARASAMSIVEDGTRAAEIISRTRLLFKKGTPQRESVDVHDVIREMIVLLHSEITRYSISVRTELAAHLPQVMGDRVQLQQVMMNLIMNSIDAMKEVGGPRELAIESQRAEHKQLLVCISDTGVGLPSQQADQIFYAFFTTKLHGTGMGLSISRSIVESHNGRLWATDNSPRGARFHVILPTTPSLPSI
jgi:NO-binding membrane sensor protein with MHYT domain